MSTASATWRSCCQPWGSANGIRNCCRYPTAYAAGLRRIERDLHDPQTPKERGDHLCFVTMRGDRG